MFLRVALIKGQISMNYRDYAKEVFYKLFLVTIFSLISPSVILYLMEPSLLRLVILLVVSTINTGLAVYYLGLTAVERDKITSMLKNKLNLNKNTL